MNVREMKTNPDISAVIEGRSPWCVVCADCLDVLKTLPAGCVDAVVTDPPYGLDYPYASYDDTPENLEALIAGYLPACRRVAFRVVVFPGITNLWRYPRATWVLSWSWNDTSHYGFAGITQWQPVLLYGPDIEGFGSINGVLKSDRIHFSDGNGIGFLAQYRSKEHPCPKPEKLMTHLVRRFSNEGQIVLDPFAGSGTTGVACVQTGRRFIGIEIDEKYAAIARRRIADAAPLFVAPPKAADPALFQGDPA